MGEEASLRAALGVLDRVLGVRRPDEVPGVVMDAVGETIDYDGAAFGALDVGGRVSYWSRSVQTVAPPLISSFELNAGTCPLVLRTRTGQIVSVRRSDLLGDRAFRATPASGKLLHEAADDHLAVVSFRLPDDRLACLALNRAARDFDEGELARLHAIGRQLSRAARFARLWRAPPYGLTPLTPGEGRVLACVAEGLTNRAAARRLGVAEATVHKHLEHAYRKMGVTNRVAATVAWLGTQPGERATRGGPPRLRIM
ncbi:MAG: hypothetical protein QOE97_1057 [Pseudonocardiales bacterium]|nr:hypothetical protein [Pseudonocardiales bacterium]